MRTAVLLAAVMLAPLYGQSRDVIKVDFTIRDTGDASGKGGRKYSMLLNSAIKGVFKIGNRVPMATSASSGAGVSTQFTYVDVGVNIDCLVQENAGKMLMHADMELSTAIAPEKGGPISNPTISQIKVGIDTAVTPGKPTVVASFDDPVTSRKFEIEAVATKVN
jgi:hypothetical protein